MWKSVRRALLEAFAMSDPVCYMHYLNWKREFEGEGEDEPRPYSAPSRRELLLPVEGASRARKEISA